MRGASEAHLLGEVTGGDPCTLHRLQTALRQDGRVVAAPGLVLDCLVPVPQERPGCTAGRRAQVVNTTAPNWIGLNDE